MHWHLQDSSLFGVGQVSDFNKGMWNHHSDIFQILGGDTGFCTLSWKALLLSMCTLEGILEACARATAQHEFLAGTVPCG